MNTFEPQAPQNLEAEEYVLSAMIKFTPAIDTCIEILDTDDFYRASHGRIFDACRVLHEAGEAVDVLTVGRFIEAKGWLENVGGWDRLREIATLEGFATNVGHHARLVKVEAIYRRLITAGQRVAAIGSERSLAPERALERAEQIVYDLGQASRKGDFVSIKDAVPATIRQLQDQHGAGNGLTGISTGFRMLDSKTTGLQPGNLIVVAGRPSMGKSALALSMIANTIAENVPTALYTMEMNTMEVANRLLTMEAHVDSNDVRAGTMGIDGWKKIMDAASILATKPLLIHEAAVLGLGELRSKTRRLKARTPELGLVVVDYLQLMDGGDNHDGRVQEISRITRGLKSLAAELQVPVIALSQLSRKVEERHDKRPMLSDLRESGSIEQDADVVILLYRDEYYNPENTDQQGVAEVNVAKQRNGPTGMVKLAFVSRYARFSNLQTATEVST